LPGVSTKAPQTSEADFVGFKILQDFEQFAWFVFQISHEIGHSLNLSHVTSPFDLTTPEVDQVVAFLTTSIGSYRVGRRIYYPVPYKQVTRVQVCYSTSRPPGRHGNLESGRGLFAPTGRPHRTCGPCNQVRVSNNLVESK